MLVSVTELAKEFNRTDRYVRLLVQSGLPRDGHGRYDLERCKTWFIAYLQSKISQRASEIESEESSDDYNLEREQARRAKAMAQLAELDLAEREHALAPIELLNRAMQRDYAVVRQQLLQLPARLSHMLEGESRIEIEQRLLRSISLALTTLSEDKEIDAGEFGTDRGERAAGEDREPPPAGPAAETDGE